jgi:diguanylate cyclase (GGDEF)-like protein
MSDVLAVPVACSAFVVAVIAAVMWVVARPEHHAAWLNVAFSIGLAVLIVGGVFALNVAFRARADRRLRREHAAHFEELARRDELSGLYNYRYFRERLRSELAAAARDHTQCALIMLDLDNFKDVNDRFGHRVGDALISAVGAAMRHAIDSRGFVARYGGDQFVIVIPDADRSTAEEYIVRVSEEIRGASTTATVQNRHIELTASCGIAIYPDDSSDGEELIARADRAVHEANAQGAAEHKRTEERHAQDVFFAIGEAIGESLDPQEMIRNLVGAIGRCLDLDSCAIRLSRDGALRIRSYYARDESFRESFRHVEENEPITRDEAMQGNLLVPRPLYIDDGQTSDAFPERYRKLMLPGMWMVNVGLPEPYEGMVNFAGRHGRCVPPPVTLVTAIARLILAALQNSETYEAARDQADQVSRLAGIGSLLAGAGEFEKRLGAVAESICETLGFDVVTLDAMDPEGNKPFCRNYYARPRASQHVDISTGDMWRHMSPALTNPDTVKFLESLGGPVVLDDAQNNPLVGRRYREVLQRSGTQSVLLVPMTWQGELKALALITSYRRGALGEREIALARAVAAQVAPALQLASLHVELKKSYDELKEAHLEAILRLAYAAEARDPYTGRHLHRIRAFSAAIARHMGLDGEQLEALGYGAVVHDLGKLRIPDSILIKAGELNEQEWKVMKRHPEYGAEFLGSSSFYDVARQVALHHHERWDGTGYPAGLQGDAIPLAARIVSVADVYDALTSDRPYKVAWPPERATAELVQMRGKTLCPESVDAFLHLCNDGVIARIEEETAERSFEFDFRERYAA